MNQPATSSSQMTQSDDPLSQLTESACAVDGERFADAVVAADTRLRRLLGRLTGQSADLDDLLQETYLNAWKGIATFRCESSMTTWLTRIAVNVARNWLRRRRPQGSLTLD
ncbi:MAG TPA: RNA polymerase subunit sigma-70, partial [Planctomycetaceae bacterium]|nr:RNA polymerase subunit sigma-70 [Planctomycetaceae bacterium]